MVELSRNYLKQVYYVDSDTIFNIKEYDDGSSCAISAETIENQIPLITAKKGTEETKKYYLDVFIEDGDEYKATGGFMKVIHNDSHERKEYTDYYKELCVETIKKAIRDNFFEDLDWFKENTSVLGVPDFMIEENGYTVTPSSIVISLTNDLDKLKKEVVWDDVVSCAKNITKSYSTEEEKYDVQYTKATEGETPATEPESGDLKLTKDGTPF